MCWLSGRGVFGGGALSVLFSTIASFKVLGKTVLLVPTCFCIPSLLKCCMRIGTRVLSSSALSCSSSSRWYDHCKVAFPVLCSMISDYSIRIWFGKQLSDSVCYNQITTLKNLIAQQSYFALPESDFVSRNLSYTLIQPMKVGGWCSNPESNPQQ